MNWAACIAVRIMGWGIVLLAAAKRSGLRHCFASGLWLPLLGLALVPLLFSSQNLLGGEVSARPLLVPSLAAGPRIELPNRAAALVLAAPATNRLTITSNVVITACSISPVAVTSVVEAIGKAVPEMAEVAAAVAAQQNAAQASSFATTAARAAPQRADRIVRAVCEAAPQHYRSIAVGVGQVVPSATREILDTLAGSFPELRPQLQRTLQTSTGIVSVAGAIDQAAAQLSRPRPPWEHPPGDPGNPLLRNPNVGPPFVPISGSFTNITTATSGTVPNGGRNYAIP